MKRAMSLACAAFVFTAATLRAEDGYDLWLRYRTISDRALLASYKSAIAHVVVEGDSPTLRAVKAELTMAFTGLLGADVPLEASVVHHGTLVLGTPTSSPIIAKLALARDLRSLGADGYLIRATAIAGRKTIVVAANSDVGVLYGTFALLREMQTHNALSALAIASAPKIQLRMLDHWDNLDGSVERGYAGKSIWGWSTLPGEVSPRYRDYARANASIGINAAAVTNVNANVKMLTAEYVAKVAVVANELRPYGIHVYLTARFSAPIEIGGLRTADPLDPAVREWWARKADEIYAAIPDFGGFLIKANSEGQPGPQDYKRTHADGANMFADAVAPHGGIVIWRAFV